MPLTIEFFFYKLSKINNKPNESFEVLYLDNQHLDLLDTSLAYCSISLNVYFCFPLPYVCLHFNPKETLSDLSEQFMHIESY